MKILIAPLHYWFSDAGSEVGWAYEFANHVRKHQPTVIVGNNIDPEMPKGLTIIELYKKRYTPSPFASFMFHIKCFLAARREVLAHNPDVIHHFLPFRLGITFNLLPLFGYTNKRKFIIGPVQTPYEGRGFDISSLIFKALSRKTLLKADSVIAITTDARDRLVKLGIPRAKIEIIPPGLDAVKYTQKAYKEPKKSFRVLFVGHLIPRKRIDLTIKAISKASQGNKNITLDIIGSGPEEAPLRGLVEELRMQSKIKFVGQLNKDSVNRAYHNSDLLVSMSPLESWGQIYLEAMASGLPVIAAESVGSMAIIDDSRTGFLVPAGDFEAMARKIAYLSQNSRKTKELGLNARSVIRARFDWGEISKKYLRLYGENNGDY